ncbi:cytochrome P450 [Tabrizicola sp.]|uniref:cytochrome P450 n=1 Tax=Tabrizicola sp. TaxID=2005166 RepID=UPI0025CE8751|nr:cytochrome P450 [Tabrizicola sp.]MBY0350422.1 cytochrome P450 [Tabrizicola sp.]MDK2774926.1 cytochrome P450 [Tabrizicola sp.]
MIPPKPEPRADKVSLWGHLRAFRRDILSAQPARLYRAWMAEFRTPFFESYLCNDPALVRRVLDERPADFPKSRRVTEGLLPLLGRSVFVTNGAEWLHQRRIIDPAFEGGRVKEAFPAIWAACEAAVARMAVGEVDVELAASHAAADVIFRTLFSIPIEDRVAQAVFHAFRAYQRSAPILNLGAFVPLPAWVPRLHRRAALRSARAIRRLIEGLTAERAAAVAAGLAPPDLATKIMTTPDPVTGVPFATAEMVDQVAIFFLAGHETSASALAWALYLLATHPEAQARVAAEAAGLRPEFGVVGSLRFTRDVFREALRLYPPVPMLVRETTMPEEFRGRMVKPGAQVVISPWHLHRHERLWDRPDDFDPDRWAGEVPQGGYLPFSRGPRVCPGAGFAMLEGTLLLAHLVRAFRFEALPGRVPVPVAHLTVRAKDGIWLRVTRR